MGTPQNPHDFEDTTDAAASQGASNVDETTLPCKNNYINIKYEYEDGTGVPGASYIVQAVTEDGSPTGKVLAEGKTDENGEAHVDLPEGYSQVEFYFYDDPKGEPYEDPDANKAIEEPEPGFFRRVWDGVVGAVDWTWGVLKGDFQEDASTAQIVTRMIVTMIPGIDQLADGQDIAFLLYVMVWRQEYKDKSNWIMLTITLFGLIPILGSLAKGVLKLVWKKADLRAVYGVFNFFKKGNAHRWLRDFARDMTGKHLKTITDTLDRLLLRAEAYMTDAMGFWGRIWGSNDLLVAGIGKIENFRGVAKSNLKEAAETLRDKLVTAMSKGMTRVEKKGTRNEYPHKVRQEKEAPPKGLRKHMDEVTPNCFDAAKYARDRAPGDLVEQKRIMKEYERQLRDQTAGLNDLTVGEYLDAREAYTRLGRNGVSDGVAQDKARERLSKDIKASVADSLENKGMSPIQAKREAAKRTKKIMSDLAALHDPDMVAGGADKIKRVGHAGVNSSIGGSWGDFENPNSRIAQIDKAAQNAASNPNIGRDAKMNTKLEPCRGRKR